MKFFSLKYKIREKLIHIHKTRDDDNYLIGLIIEELEPKLKEMTAIELVNKIKHGQYGSIESITRCRRILQEKYPDLRGQLWEKRHDFSKEVERQLKFQF